MKDFQRSIDDLIVLGDEASARRDNTIARQHYQEAALLTQGRLKSVPLDARKTRGIIVSSAATLYVQAHEYEHARRFLYQSLSSGDLLPETEARLEELLAFVLDRITLDRQNYEYTGDGLGIALRGGEVGRGTAPADVVVNAMNSWKTLVIRFAESALALPYRPRGAVSPALLQAVSARISQPMIGSFKFDLRLSRAKQPNLLDQRVLETLVDDLAEFIRATSTGDLDAVTKRVPSKQYRETILELTKAIIPTGRTVRELGITIRRQGSLSNTEDLVVRPELRVELAALIKAARPEPSMNKRTIEGVLRGLQLNNQWIIVDVDDNTSQTLRIDSEAFEDIIGIMVNRPVRIEAEELPNRQLRVITVDIAD